MEHGEATVRSSKEGVERLGGTVSSPGARRAGRRGAGSSGTAAMVLDARRPARGRRGPRRRLRAPRPDSVLQEGEEDEAKTMAAMASSRVVGNGGTVRRPTVAVRGSS